MESEAVWEGRVGQILDPRASREDLGDEFLPVRDLTYVLDARLHLLAGERPWSEVGKAPPASFVFRLTNLLWYGLACGLATAFLLTLLDPKGGEPTPGPLPPRRLLALVAAALFCLHPAHAESAAWVAGRKDVVSAAFVFGALLLHLHARRSGRLSLYLASALCAGLACLAKSTATAIPFLVLAIELYSPAGASRLGRGARVLPSLVVCGAAALLAIWVGSKTGIGRARWWNPLEVGFLMDPPIVRRYVVTSFLPWRLHINHHELLTVVLDPHGPRWIAAGLSWLALIPLGLLAWWTKRRLVWFSAVWFLAALVPVLNFVPHQQLVADRFLFLPLLGPCLVGAWALTHLARARPRLGRVVIGLVLLALATVSLLRGLEFRTSVSLWEAQFALEPDDPVALRHLGEAHLTRAAWSDDPARALEEAEGTLEYSVELFERAKEENRPLNQGHYREALILRQHVWFLKRVTGDAPHLRTAVWALLRRNARDLEALDRARDVLRITDPDLAARLRLEGS